MVILWSGCGSMDKMKTLNKSMCRKVGCDESHRVPIRVMRVVVRYIAPYVLLVSCALPGAEASDKADVPEFLPGRRAGTVETKLITEASGIVASRKNPPVLWVHNDS